MKSFGPILNKNQKKLEFLDVELPPLRPTQIRVLVRYAGLNRADVQQSKGVYPPPPGESEILGLECSGVVEAVGPSVTRFKIGDQVICLLGGGGFGTRVQVDEELALPVPSYLSLQEAGALPESLFTFWLNAVMEGGLEISAQPAQAFLTHGGAAGLGSFSVAMAKAMGARVISSARGQARVDFVRSLGADLVVNTEGLSTPDVCLALASAGKVDVILDHIGADYFETHLSMLNRKGALVMINNVGTENSSIDIRSVVFKRLRVVGSLLRSRTLDEKALIAADVRTRALPLMERVQVPVRIDSVTPIAEIDRAIRRLEDRKSLGKIVLQVGES